MSEQIEIRIFTKGELRSGPLPKGWSDPEDLTHVAPHHRVMFLENPLSRGDDDPIRAYALVDGQVAGKVSLIHGEVRIGERAIPALWGFDLLVSTRFRGRGLAIKLIQAWQNHYPFAIGTHVNLPSVGIYRKFDWVEFHTPCYVSILSPTPFLAGHLKSRGLAVAASPLASLALATWRAVAPTAVKPGLRAEPAPTLSDEFDAVLSKQAAPVQTHRSAAWVNWQLRVGAANEVARYHLCYVRNDRGDRVGYFILQIKVWPLLSGRYERIRLASMRDWGLFDATACDIVSLAKLAEAEARRLGAEALHVTVLGEEPGRILRRQGFRPVNPLMTLFHADPSSPLADERFRDQASWRFTPAEADGLVV